MKRILPFRNFQNSIRHCTRLNPRFLTKHKTQFLFNIRPVYPFSPSSQPSDNVIKYSLLPPKLVTLSPRWVTFVSLRPISNDHFGCLNDYLTYTLTSLFLLGFYRDPRLVNCPTSIVKVFSVSDGLLVYQQRPLLLLVIQNLYSNSMNNL